MRDYQIVLIAGGLGERLLSKTKHKIPKCLIMVSGKTLIDHTIDFYKKSGFKKFVFLTGVMGEHVEAWVKKFHHEIDMTFSQEKEKLGKAGAIKFALENKKIDRNKPCIVHYPDDLIFMKNFPERLIERHEIGKKKGALGTLVKVPGTYYPYGETISDKEGFIIDMVEKPWVEKPANVGIYVLEPEILKMIDEMVNLKKKPIDFETDILPKIVKKKRAIFDFVIPFESWIPVNDERDFRRAEEALKKSNI